MIRSLHRALSVEEKGIWSISVLILPAYAFQETVVKKGVLSIRALILPAYAFQKSEGKKGICQVNVRIHRA